MNRKVLVADDDKKTVDLVRLYLEKDGYNVLPAYDGQQALELARHRQPDLLVLDLMLPKIDGLDVCRILRAETRLPIILLTARTTEDDKLLGLDLGADDYVTKPFSPRELLARVRAVLRRYRVQATLPERDSARRAFRFAGWELNLRTRRLTSPAGAAVDLSNGEFSLLAALCRAPQRVLSRDQLLSMSRLHESEVYDRAVDVQIRRLRMKIEDDAAAPGLIVTERGAGYRLACEVESLY
jgi:two-component system, OmpR family, response regulator